jgi:hypothetical protein
MKLYCKKQNKASIQAVSCVHSSSVQVALKYYYFWPIALSE